jgi:catechol 2,3-dioxygenase-like lactoylglutathione lyase family enzyme
VIAIQSLHHVSLAVTNLERSRAFYRDVLDLEEIARPPFDFAGAWYRIGDSQLHLIVHDQPTLRTRGIDSRDVHFAMRVDSYRETLAQLHAHGYATDARDELKRLRESPAGRAGFPQVFLLDPDRHVIELNAAGLEDSGRVTPSS